MAASRFARLLRSVQSGVGVGFVRHHNGSSRHSSRRYLFSVMAATAGGGAVYAIYSRMQNKQGHVLSVAYARNQEVCGLFLFVLRCCVVFQESMRFCEIIEIKLCCGKFSIQLAHGETEAYRLKPYQELLPKDVLSKQRRDTTAQNDVCFTGERFAFLYQPLR